MIHFEWPIRLAITAVLSTVGVTACASSRLPDVPEDMERISFRAQPPPFCWRCESVDLTVAADGRMWLETGYWAGNYRDWRRDRRLVHLGPEEFLAFKARLAPYRPDRDVVDDQADCKDYLTDNDGAIVEWFSGGDKRVRVFDFGCRDEGAMVDAVRSAPEILLTQTRKVR